MYFQLKLEVFAIFVWILLDTQPTYQISKPLIPYHVPLLSNLTSSHSFPQSVKHFIPANLLTK